MHAGRMRKREKKASSSAIRVWEARLETLKQIRDSIDVYWEKRGKGHSSSRFWPRSSTACSTAFHLLSIWVENDWLWSNQAACRWDKWVSEPIWGNVYRPAYPAASINLHHQIKQAEINPDQLGDMQITPPYVNDGAAVSKVDGNPQSRTVQI